MVEEITEEVEVDDMDVNPEWKFLVDNVCEIDDMSFSSATSIDEMCLGVLRSS